MDYSKDKKKQLKERKEFFNLRTVNVHTERDHLISADVESDASLTKHADFLKTFHEKYNQKYRKRLRFMVAQYSIIGTLLITLQTIIHLMVHGKKY